MTKKTWKLIKECLLYSNINPLSQKQRPFSHDNVGRWGCEVSKPFQLKGRRNLAYIFKT